MFTNCFMGKAIDRDIITSSKRLVHKHLKRYTQKYRDTLKHRDNDKPLSERSLCLGAVTQARWTCWNIYI